MYSLLGNRQGDEEDQDEPRALEGIFPREGGPERETRRSGRLHEQHTNKEVCGNLAPGTRTHTSVKLLS